MSSLPAGRAGGGGNNDELERSRSAKRARREEVVPPPSSDPFSNIPPDALTMVLKYARPSDDIHRFEFAWSVGKISKSLREHRILDELPVAPFHLEEYEEYSPLNGTDDREPVDCRAALVKALVVDPTKCALISELHITRQSIEKRDCRINSGMVTSLRSLLTKEGAFKNAQSLSINLTPDPEVYGYANISLLNKAMLKKMPKSFPVITDVALGHCFSPEILVSHSGNLFPAFFQSFQTPLKRLALLCIPGLTDSHVGTVLSAIGNNLTRIEIDSGGNHFNDGTMFIGSDMFNALIANGKRLESLSLCGVTVTSDHLRKVLSSIAGLKELVLKRIVHRHVILNGGYQELNGSEAERRFAALFRKYGEQLESFHCDFSDTDVGSDALDNLVFLQYLQLRALSDAENADADGAPKMIKLQKVGMGPFHPDSIALAIQTGVREFEMSGETEVEARDSIDNICYALLERDRHFSHEVVFRFGCLEICFYIKAGNYAGAVDSGSLFSVHIESGTIGSDERIYVDTYSRV